MTEGPSELEVATAQGNFTLQYNKLELSVRHTDKGKHYTVPVLQVLWAEATQDTAEVCFLAKYGSTPLKLRRIVGTVTDASSAREWTERLMNAAYEGVKRNRRLKVLVNPRGGVGKAPSIFRKIVEPIFRLARCSIDVTFTTHVRHGYEIAKALPLDFDAIATLSGDGLVHEVINGFADHEHSEDAFSISVVPIPAGSGNGLSLNLLGIEGGFNIAAAALNAIKGRPMKTDLFLVTQNNKRTYSFMSQALGLMADLDLGTENLRWMGDTRFMVGLLKGIAQFKPCPVQLSIKIAEKDKATMVRTAQAKREVDGNDGVAPTSVSHDGRDFTKSSPVDEPEWYTFDKPLLYVYAGQGPYVARDYMAFPVSLPNDGLIDVVVQELSTRGDILSAISGAVKGQNFWRNTVHYFKARAYRVKPMSTKGYLSVDGETFPFQEFQVEVHPRKVSFLSPLGRYAVDFPS